jgi:hypothetical protein
VVRSRPPAAVRLPREVVERLVEYAMDMLWSTDQDARMAPSYDGGCCPICCTPCSALKLLLDTDRLDELAVRGKGSSWWSTTENGVDRGFLEHAWRKTSCHASEGWQLDDES